MRKVSGKEGKFIRNFLLLWIAVFIMTGCGREEKKCGKKIADYSVTSEDKLPQELKSLIDDKKTEPFKMTYQDEGYLYICQGYGTRETGGYSIQVKDIYHTDNAIYFSSTLIGPTAKEAGLKAPSYPYIVIKLEYTDMTVVFDS